MPSWLEGWGYRKSHVINPASGAGTNYQVRIVAHYGSGTDSGPDVYLNGRCRTDFGDIRFCYSPDTEVLTENGFLLLKDIVEKKLKVKIASMNPENGKLSYHYPTDYVKLYYKGKMFHQKGTCIDLLVTPEHRMFVRKAWNGRKGKPFEFIEACKLPRHVEYKRDADWDGKEVKNFYLPSVTRKSKFGNPVILRNITAIPMDDWLRFFGIWIAEGPTFIDRGRYKVHIAQRNKVKRKTILEWARRCGFNAKEKPDGILIWSKQLYEYLKQFGHAENKFIPKEFKQLSKRQLKILFEALMFGDGFKRKSSWVYGTASKQLADDVHEIALKLGYVTTIKKRRGGTIAFGKYRRKGLYVLSISKNNVTPAVNSFKDNREWIDYEGFVYDITLPPYHLLYIRRNGKACWSSNCGSDGVTLLSYWIEEKVDGDHATIWVQITDDLSTNPVTIYIYYGNPNATRADDPQNIDLWQLREHQADTTYHPDIRFSKPTASVIRIDSYSGGASSFGRGYVFIIMPKSYLNGKKVQVRWNVYYSYADSRDLVLGRVIVLDTELNRKQTLAIGDIENLFTYIEATHYPGPLGAPAGWLGWRTDTSGVLDLSTFTEDYVTLMIRLRDSWTSQTVVVDVDWIKILDANGNVLLTFDFDKSVVMEVTGTYEDYGLYRKYVSPEPSHGSWGAEESFAYYVYVSDAGSGLDLAWRGDSFVVASDFGTGLEARLSPLFLSASDIGLTVELVIGKFFSALDSAVGSELAPRILLSLLDQATTIEQVVYIAAGILKRDYGYGAEQAYKPYAENMQSDQAVGSEVRLSPQFRFKLDSAVGIDQTSRKDMRYLKDLASTLEQAVIGLNRFDTALAQEILTLEKILKDLAVGSEVRLSPIPLSASDIAYATERSWFYWWEGLRTDQAIGTDQTAVKNMKPIIDQAVGSEVTKFGRLLKDTATATEMITYVNRTFRDQAFGAEQRISPSPLFRSDVASGLERAWFYWWEGKRIDQAVGTEKMVKKLMKQLDTASTIEQAFIGLKRADQALALEKIIHRALTTLDQSVGMENRLSPIPIKTTDLALALEKVIHRTLETLDQSIGTETSKVQLYLPPLPQIINATITSSTHLGAEAKLLTQKPAAQLATALRDFSSIQPTRTLPQQIQITKTMQTRGITAFARLIQLTLEATRSANIQQSLFIKKTFSNMPSANIQTLTRSGTAFAETLTQNINLEKLLTAKASLYKQTLTQNLLQAFHTQQTRPDTGKYASLTEIVTYAFDHAKRQTYTAPLILSQAGKLYTVTEVKLSPEQTFKTIEAMDKVTILLPMLASHVPEQYLRKTITQPIYYSYTASSSPITNIIRQTITQILLSGGEHRTKQALITPVTLTPNLILALAYKPPRPAFQSTLLTLPILHGLGWMKEYRTFIYEVIYEILCGIFSLPAYITTAYKYLKQLQDLALKFRYVNIGDYILHTDHNTIVEACQIFLKFAETLVNDLFKGDVDLTSKIEEMRTATSKLRKVLIFDIVTARDHNLTVECINKIREFIKLVRHKIGLNP
jgi:hypothetical protein